MTAFLNDNTPAETFCSQRVTANAVGGIEPMAETKKPSTIAQLAHLVGGNEPTFEGGYLPVRYKRLVATLNKALEVKHVLNLASEAVKLTWDKPNWNVPALHEVRFSTTNDFEASTLVETDIDALEYDLDLDSVVDGWYWVLPIPKWGRAQPRAIAFGMSVVFAECVDWTDIPPRPPAFGPLGADGFGISGIWSNGPTMYIGDHIEPHDSDNRSLDDIAFVPRKSATPRDYSDRIILHDFRVTVVNVLDLTGDSNYLYALSRKVDTRITTSINYYIDVAGRFGNAPAKADFRIQGTRQHGIPRGIASDGTTMWVCFTDVRLPGSGVFDPSVNVVRAYRISNWSRDTSKDISPVPAATDMFTDGETLWIGPTVAYDLSTKTRQPSLEYPFSFLRASGIGFVNVGVWTDGLCFYIATPTTIRGGTDSIHVIPYPTHKYSDMGGAISAPLDATLKFEWIYDLALEAAISAPLEAATLLAHLTYDLALEATMQAPLAGRLAAALEYDTPIAGASMARQQNGDVQLVLDLANNPPPGYTTHLLWRYDLEWSGLPDGAKFDRWDGVGLGEVYSTTTPNPVPPTQIIHGTGANPTRPVRVRRTFGFEPASVPNGIYTIEVTLTEHVSQRFAQLQTAIWTPTGRDVTLSIQYVEPLPT